jgi:hypothetical protein
MEDDRMSRTKTNQTQPVEEVQQPERKKPQLDPRWIIEIEGNQFVKFAGLLDLGHQKGIAQIDVAIVQLPTADNGNFAICRATVTSKEGEVFADIGDATPANCSSKVSKHLLRLASTRAIARALRSFTNIGITCLEELADLSDIEGNNSEGEKIRPSGPASAKPKSQRKQNPVPDNGNNLQASPQPRSINSPEQTESQGNGGNGGNSGHPPAQAQSSQNQSPGMSPAQRNAILNISRRRGLSSEELGKITQDGYGVDFEFLTRRDASSLITQLQTNAWIDLSQ